MNCLSTVYTTEVETFEAASDFELQCQNGEAITQLTALAVPGAVKTIMLLAHPHHINNGWHRQHRYTDTQTHTHTQTHTDTQSHRCTHTHAYTRTHTHAHARTRTHTVSGGLEWSFMCSSAGSNDQKKIWTESKTFVTAGVVDFRCDESTSGECAQCCSMLAIN